MDLRHKGEKIMEKYSVVDLFAGAGGLSLGFMQTQKYDVKVAFENNKNMRRHTEEIIRELMCKGMYVPLIIMK